MKKKTICMVLLLLPCVLFAQSQTNHWYFGEKAGIDFSFGNRTVNNDGNLSTPAGCSSISDSDGNLLFYTNGKTVYNRNHQVMDNGENLATTLDNVQTSIIIPIPDSSTNFYIFTTKTTLTTNPVITEGVFLSEVEISTAFPLGRLVSKNISIRESSSERITAVHHADGKSIWLIIFGPSSRQAGTPINTFSIFKIDEQGLNTPIVTQVEETVSKKGAMKVSPNGKYIAVADYGKENIDVYNFNSETGEISLKQKIFTDTTLFNPKSPYGVEFSSDSKFLYYTAEVKPFEYSSINQFYIENPFPNNPDADEKKELLQSSDVYFGSLQLANDGKIYVSSFSQNENSISPVDKISVIENINTLNPSVNLLSLGLESGKSLLGLPNFIQSYFRNRIINEDDCVSNTFNFTLETYLPIQNISWDFGDGSTSNNLNANHIYKSPGNYIVKAIINENTTNKSVLYKKITVYPLPNLKKNQELVECDDDVDGVTLFNLKSIIPKVTNPSLNQEYFFYLSKFNAENKLEEISDPENYTNLSSPNEQEIFLRVENEFSCYKIVSFKIKTKIALLGNISDFFSCEIFSDLTKNGEGLFNSRQMSIDIKNQLSISDRTILKFFPTYQDAQRNTNEFNGVFSSKSTTIFLKVIEPDLSCAGIQSLNVIVNPRPLIDIQDNYILCHNPSIKPPIILSASSNNERFEWRDASNNILSTNQNFTLTTVGEFSLTVYKTENGIECSNSKTFTVVNPEIPIFLNATPNTEDETNNTISVSISGNSNYEFSLDNINFFGNGTSYTFSNVEAGLQTVYVRDINNCEQPIQTNVSVIGFKKYFTPNGDGKNDFWNIKGLDPANFKSINVSIFDRFGKIIFTIKDLNSIGWDGNYNGKPLNENNYWFKAEIVDKDDNIINEAGNFSLIRN